MPPKIANRAPVLATHAVNFRSTHSASVPNPHIDTQRSLFAHPHSESQPSTQISDEIKTQIAERLKDCLEGNKPMVSFHSPRGYQKCRSLCDQTIPAPDQDPQRPSLLQYCLQAQASSQDLQITIDEKKYTLKFESLVFEDGGQSATSPVKHIKGQLLLNPENPSEQVKMIRFVEMAPPFDGYALSADDLVKCAEQTHLLRENGQAFKGQFSSANGICRSASLLIVDQFNELIHSNPIDENLNVDKTVEELISTMRCASGQHGLIPHANQEQAIKEACTELLIRYKTEQAKQTQATHTAQPIHCEDLTDNLSTLSAQLDTEKFDIGGESTDEDPEWIVMGGEDEPIVLPSRLPVTDEQVKNALNLLKQMFAQINPNQDQRHLIQNFIDYHDAFKQVLAHSEQIPADQFQNWKNEIINTFKRQTQQELIDFISQSIIPNLCLSCVKSFKTYEPFVSEDLLYLNLVNQVLNNHSATEKFTLDKHTALDDTFNQLNQALNLSWIQGEKTVSLTKDAKTIYQQVLNRTKFVLSLELNDRYSDILINTSTRPNGVHITHE